MPSFLALSHDLFSAFYMLQPHFQLYESTMPLCAHAIEGMPSTWNAHPTCLTQVICTYLSSLHLNVTFFRLPPRSFSLPRLDWSLPIFAYIVPQFSILQNFSHLELFIHQNLACHLCYILLFLPYFLAFVVVETHSRCPVTICYRSFFCTFTLSSMLINHKCVFSIQKMNSCVFQFEIVNFLSVHSRLLIQTREFGIILDFLLSFLFEPVPWKLGLVYCARKMATIF